MNTLEKILEEIESDKNNSLPIEALANHCYREGYVAGMALAQDIIKEHMVEKKKVTSAEVISETFDGKQYYEIKYREVGKNDYAIGYGSYVLRYVLEWLNECFEFCEEAKVTSYLNDGWIPVSERLPEEHKARVRVGYRCPQCGRTEFRREEGMESHEVWVCFRELKLGRITYGKSRTTNGKWDLERINGEEFIKILAWHSLPGEYKGGQENE